MHNPPLDQAEFFQFEADFVDSLRCIPMQVRYKLDTCGVKLKLSHWHQLDAEQREQLVVMPCHSATETERYRTILQQWVCDRTGSPAGELSIDPAPAWLNPAAVPEDVQTQSQHFDVTLTSEQWQALSPLQRFALIKLSRPSHENKNFLPALQEFNLTSK